MNAYIRIKDQLFMLPISVQGLKNRYQPYLIQATNAKAGDAIRIQTKDLYTHGAFAGCSETVLEDFEASAALHNVAEVIPSIGMFLMHGTVIAMDGYAYMLTAKSGVGKTTRAKLWLEEFPGSYILNGDKPFLRVTEESVLACGTPWNGKENLGRNEVLPLRAIYIVERDEENLGIVVERITLYKAFLRLYAQQIHQPADPEMQRKTVRLIDEMLHRVPVYRFRAKPERKGVRQAWETARRQESWP